MVLWCVAK